MRTAPSSESSRMIRAFILACVLLKLSESRFLEPLLYKETSHKYGDSCDLEETSTGNGAGIATNVQAKCVHEIDGSKEFYQEISWVPPVISSSPVTGYRIYIAQKTRTCICFQLPASNLSFKFTRSVGLVSDTSFLFIVTPQPIARVGDKFTQKMHRAADCQLK